MDIFTITAVILLLLSVLLIVIKYRQQLAWYWRFRKKLHKIPTIKYNFFLGHLVYVLGPFNQVISVIYNLIKTAPKVCHLWFGPIPMTGVYRPQDLEEVLSNMDCNDKPFLYQFMSPWLGNGLLLSGGAKWHTRRKLLTPAFHFKILENFIEVFAKKSIILVKNLEKEVGSQSFDITGYIAMCTLDIICETAMGVEINAQGLGGESEYVKTVGEISYEIMRRVMSPWFYLDTIFYLSPAGRKFKKHVKILHNFTTKVIRDRKSYYDQMRSGFVPDENTTGIGLKRRLAFLDLMFEASNNGANLSEGDILEEVNTFMFEGHDTTASALSWAVQLLACHPDVQEEAYKEQESIFFGADREPTMKDLNEMKYLERVLKETLRLYPSVPFIGRYVADDVEVNGHIIPAGGNFVTSFYLTHRDPEQFPDPEKFNPDNFLPENAINRHPFAYLPFSAGPRNCIGQKFAMLEMKMVLSYILRRYKLVATREVPLPLPELTTKPENGVHVSISPRKFTMM